MKLFVMGQDGVVILNNELATLYPSIRKIISRDRGGKVSGDSDGRHKFYAFRELTYVYFTCDFDAYPAQHGLSDIETHLYAAKHSNLGKDYKPDEVVQSLMKQYTDEHLTQTKKTIKSLIRVFALNDKIISKIEKNLTDSLELPTLTAQMISDLLTYQKQLISIATDVPAVSKKLKEAMNLLEEEGRVKEILRGKEEKPDSMDPGNSIENIE